MKQSTKLKYKMFPSLLKDKIRSFSGQNYVYIAKEFEDIVNNFGFKTIEPTLRSIKYVPKLYSVNDIQLLENEDFVNYSIEMDPWNIWAFNSEDDTLKYFKPEYIDTFVETFKNKPEDFFESLPTYKEDDEYLPDFIYRNNAFADFIIDCLPNNYIHPVSENILFHGLCKYNPNKAAEYLATAFEHNKNSGIKLDDLSEEIINLLMSNETVKKYMYSNPLFANYYKEEEIDKLTEEEAVRLIEYIRADYNNHYHIESKRLVKLAIEHGYSEIVGHDGYHSIYTDYIPFDEIYELCVKCASFNIDFLDPNEVNETNLDKFVEISKKCNMWLDDTRLLYMLIDKKVDFEVIFHSFKFRMLTDDVIISKLFSYTSLNKLLNHISPEIIDKTHFDKDILLNKFNSMCNTKIDSYNDHIELLFIISKLKEYDLDDKTKALVDEMIESIKRGDWYRDGYTGNDFNCDELIDLIVEGKRSALNFLNFYGNGLKLKYYKYVVKYGDIRVRRDDLLTIDCIPEEVIDKTNRKHILEIMDLVKNIYIREHGKDYTMEELISKSQREWVSLAFRIYMSLGYERSVNFLSEDPKKNYGLVNTLTLLGMFQSIDLYNLIFEQKGNGYVPVLNEKLLNIVFGNSNKALNTPIRNYLNEYNDKINEINIEKEKIRNNLTLQEEEKKEKLNKLDSQLEKYKNETKIFIKTFYDCVNHWDIIEEEFYKKENKAKLKMKMTPSIINEILKSYYASGVVLDSEKDKKLIESDVFDYVGVDNQYVKSISTVKARTITLSRRMDDVISKKFPKIEISSPNYQLRVFDSQDRGILCAGHKSKCCFRPNGNADDEGKDTSLLNYCVSTEYGGGVEIVDDKGEIVMFSPILRNGNVLMIHSVETKNYFDKEAAELLTKFAEKLIEESEKVGDNIEIVTLGALHNTENVESLGVLPTDKKFRIYDEEEKFIGMYNNLSSQHLILAHKKGIEKDDTKYGKVEHSYIYHEEENFKNIIINPEIVEMVSRINELNNEIIDLTNRRKTALEKGKEKESYELLSQIKDKKKEYISKYSKLLRDYKGVDYFKELIEVLRKIHRLEKNVDFGFEDLSNYVYISYSPKRCILRTENGEQIVITQQNKDLNYVKAKQKYDDFHWDDEPIHLV